MEHPQLNAQQTTAQRGTAAIAPSRKPNEAQADFDIYTDGSGHSDKYGASAAVIFSLKHKIYARRFAAFYGVSVNRAELQGLLLGLRAIMEDMDWNNPESHARLKAYPPIVHWHGDRENLMKSVALDVRGTPLYSRRTDPDLWAQYAWYEKLFKVIPCQVKRNTLPAQAACDAVCGELRTLMLEFAASASKELADTIQGYAQSVFDNKLM